MSEVLLQKSKSLARRRAQENYYLAKIQEHGMHSACAVGWTDYLQILLFEKIMRLFSSRHPRECFSVLDVGCGLGDFSHFLRLHGYCNVKYFGIDIMPTMVDLAKKKYPNEHFFVADFADDAFEHTFDYIVCSGTLNIISEKNYKEHEKFVRSFIKKMYNLSQCGIAFNLLSCEGKDFFPSSNKFYYANSSDIAQFCKSFAKDVFLYNDEKEFSFTVIIKK